MSEQLKFQVLRSQDFNEWFDDLIELKWTSGLRVYTARIGQMVIVVLGGGNKSGQNKDIKKAKKTLEKIKKSYLGGS